VVIIPRQASDSDVLAIVRDWVDVLARKDYEAFFQSLGCGVAIGQPPGAAIIRHEIAAYRSVRIYPGIDEFVVTDWRTAVGGKLSPMHQVTRYKPNDLGLAGAVDFDLPLNGRWSDLAANFVFRETQQDGGGYVLSLEDFSSPPP
jgi:hypothetical protein